MPGATGPTSHGDGRLTGSDSTVSGAAPGFHPSFPESAAQKRGEGALERLDGLREPRLGARDVLWRDGLDRSVDLRGSDLPAAPARQASTPRLPIAYGY